MLDGNHVTKPRRQNTDRVTLNRHQHMYNHIYRVYCFMTIYLCMQQPAVVCQECTVAHLRAEDCTFPAVVLQWLGNRDCTGSRGVCLPWLSYPLINRKHLWHQPPKCHHSCCHAELRKSDLEVTARHLNEVEAVQHVYITNIPVWFGLLGDI